MGAVPNLDELLDQLNTRFPKRKKDSDGLWGDKAHQNTTSSHNGDKSGTPEWRDGDNKDEVRGRDIDKDLNDPNCTMEQVVQMWVTALRAGKLWWVRYIIYNGRIWHRRDGFKTRLYKGKNKHTEHVHVNSDFSQKADEVTKTDWLLKDFRKPKPPVKPTTPAKPAPDKSVPPKPSTPAKPTAPATPKPPAELVVDGELGPETIKRWQDTVHHRTVTTKMDKDFIKAMQIFFRDRVDHRIDVDGIWGPQTTSGLQRYIKCPVSRVMDKTTVIALQRRLNTGSF